MTNRKSILTLMVLLLLLAGANVLLRSGIGETKAAGRRTLVEDVEGVRRITLERKGRAAVTLVKDDVKWRLVSPYAGSVDEQVIMKFLDILSLTPITDVLSESALLKLGRTRSDFALDEPVLSVSLDSGIKPGERLEFGSKTPLADGVYASINGMDSVFVVPVSMLEDVDVDAERFRRRSLFTIDANTIASFVIKRRTDSLLEFGRTGDGWRLKNAKASAEKVTGLLAKIISASAESFVWPVGASNEADHVSAALLVGYGLDPDAAVTLTVKDSDGSDRRISFGKEAQEGHVYALVHGGAAIVTLPSDLKALADQDESAFTDSRIFSADARSVGLFSILDHDTLYAFVQEKDGVWALESPIVARADGEAVTSLLSRILSLSSSDAAAPEDGVAVSIATNTAKTVVSRASVFGTMKPEEFRSKEVVRIDPVLVKRIVRTDSEGAKPIAVVYDRERKVWNLESGGENIVPNPKGIDTALSALNPLVALRIEKLKVSAADLDDFGLDKPFLTVAVDQEVEGMTRRNIIIGKKAAGGRFATIGSSDAVFVIGEEQVNKISSNIVGK